MVVDVLLDLFLGHRVVALVEGGHVLFRVQSIHFLEHGVSLRIGNERLDGMSELLGDGLVGIPDPGVLIRQRALIGFVWLRWLLGRAHCRFQIRLSLRLEQMW